MVQRIFVLLIIDPETFQYSGLLDTYVLLCCRQYRECSECVYNFTCIKTPFALRLAGFSLCYSTNDESKLYLMCAHACTTCGSNLYTVFGHYNTKVYIRSSHYLHIVEVYFFMVELCHVCMQGQYHHPGDKQTSCTKGQNILQTLLFAVKINSHIMHSLNCSSINTPKPHSDFKTDCKF